MADDAPSIFSLELTTKEQLNRLCQHLWDWKTCENCSHHQPCLLPICSWQRLSRLEPFFQYYKELAASYVSDAFVPHETPALRSHEDLLAIIHLINKRPNQIRADLVKEYFSSRNGSEEVLSADQQIALNIAVKVLLMMDCTVDGHVGGNFEMGGEPSVWHRHQSWEEFISATFPKRDHPSLDEEDKTAPDIKARLKATKLKKTAHLSSEGTNDIRNHLRLDQKTGVVEIFHHTTVLKEHLKASKASHYEGLSNVSPRQLALETLDSLQKILFPLDNESRFMLRSLVSKRLFDPDCLSLEFPSYRLEHERDIKYQYWGSRLMDLCDEIENPKPRGLIDIWLEQRSKARHVMLATLVGVIIAIVLGILGLVVGIFQAWVAYEAWKHLVNGSS